MKQLQIAMFLVLSASFLACGQKVKTDPTVLTENERDKIQKTTALLELARRDYLKSIESVQKEQDTAIAGACKRAGIPLLDAKGTPLCQVNPVTGAITRKAPEPAQPQKEVKK